MDARPIGCVCNLNVVLMNTSFFSWYYLKSIGPRYLSVVPFGL